MSEENKKEFDEHKASEVKSSGSSQLLPNAYGVLRGFNVTRDAKDTNSVEFMSKNNRKEPNIEKKYNTKI